jgi:class 3 adenylate cyclase
MDLGIETFLSYVPMDRRQALAHGTILGDRASGAVLFADISGFTPLTATLYKELGPQRGAEELDRILNQVFGLLIDRIHQYRGSVIGFSGDAITCWFDGDDGLWATACALTMQDVVVNMGSIEVPGGISLPLDIKVSVAAGRARRLITGDQAIQVIDTLAGELLDRVAEGERIAARGEVIVCADIAQNLGDQLLVAQKRTAESGQIFFLAKALAAPVAGRPWLDLPQGIEDQESLRPWLLPPVYDRLNTGHGQFLAELRNSVALFLSFDGLDYDGDTEVGEKLDQFIRRVQRILAYFGGSLLNLTIGDKGSYLLCSFGAPVAHEDNARRAVSAALDLLNLPGELGDIDDVRIGISQGIMFSGAYGSEIRRTYGILGEETNIAARLMGKAEAGEVIVSERIADATSQSHSYQDILPLSVKGVAEPIPVFRLLARRRAPGHLVAKAESEMVGRTEERALLHEQLFALQNGSTGGVTIIQGEAGIGKSRLLEDLLQEAEAQGQATYLGAADAIEKNAAYHAWRDVFWDLFELDSAPDAEPPGAGRLSSGQRQLVFDRLQTAVPDKERLAPLLNTVLPTDLPENNLTAQMTGEIRAGNTQDLLVALLHARTEETPLLLVVEDAHWLDSASWALTRIISRDIPTLLLVIATRPLSDPLPAEYSALLARANTQRLVLSALPPDETLQLVRLRLGVDMLPDAVEELLLEKAGGHPFFSEELAYALRDSGLLVVENGAGRLTAGEAELAALSFPDSIDSVITSRIDLLTPQQQLTLKIASVIGRVFPFSTLCDIYPVAADRPQLHEQLDTLERLDITLLETPEPDLSYIFKHIITQEVAYNLMSFAQRQGLHQAIAQWLERTYRNDLAPYYQLIAYHFQRALGDDYSRTDLGTKALNYLELAAEQALDNYANKEAIEFFNQLLTLDEALGRPVPTLKRARWKRGLGESFFRSGDWHQSVQHFDKTVAMLGHPVPHSSAALALGIARQSIAQALSFFHSRHTYENAAELSQDAHDAVLEAAHAYRSLVQIYYYLEERNLFIYAGLHNANLARRLGRSPEMLAAYANLGVSVGYVPIHNLARAYLRRVTDMAKGLDNLPAKSWALFIAAYYYLYAGSSLVTEPLAQQGADLAARIGYWRSWEESTMILALSMIHRGAFQEAVKACTGVVSSARRRGDGQTEIWGICGRVEARKWTVDDWGAPMANLQQAQCLLDGKNINTNDRIRVHGLFAKKYLRAGDDQLALEEAQEVLDLSAKTGFLIPYAREGYHGALDVFLTLWEKAEASSSQDQLASFARQALKPVRQMGRTFPVIAPRAWLQQGRYDWLLGNHSKAQKAWRKSIELARELSMPHEEGLSHYEYGRHLPPGDPGRDKRLTRALELFSRVGANYYVNRTRKEMNTLER